MQLQSHGESFLAVLRHRFEEVGVYFLDEPEAAISFYSRLGLVSLLDTMRTLVHRDPESIAFKDIQQEVLA